MQVNFQLNMSQAEYEWFTVYSIDQETTRPILNSGSDEIWSIRNDDELNESYVTLIDPRNESISEINALCFLWNYSSEITFTIGTEVKIPTAKNRPSVIVYPKNYYYNKEKKLKCIPRGFPFTFYDKEVLNFQPISSNVSFNLYLVSDYGGYTHKKQIQAQLASLHESHPDKMKILVFDDEKWKFNEHVLGIDEEPKRISPISIREKSFMLVFIDLVVVEDAPVATS